MIILRVCFLPLRSFLLTPPPLHNHLLSPRSSPSSWPNPPASPVLLLCLVLAPAATRCSCRGTLGLRRCSVAICATLTRPWQPPSSPHPPRSGQPWRYGTLVTWADVFKELRPWNSLHCIDADMINTHTSATTHGSQRSVTGELQVVTGQTGRTNRSDRLEAEAHVDLEPQNREGPIGARRSRVV